MTRRGALTIVAVLVALLTAAAPASAAPRTMPGCADPDVPGGEWRSFGHDLDNTRTQPREKTIAPADAPLLTPAFTFSTAEAGVEGDFTGTPIVADGCIYVATNRGWALAINADNGKLVWKTKFPQGGTANNTVGIADRACGKSVKYRKKVVKRRVRGKIVRKVKRVRVAKTKYCPTIFVGATRTRGSLSGDTDVDQVEGCPHKSCTGPYAFALEQATGKVAWLSAPIDEQTGSDLYSSPVIFDGLMMLGVSGGAAELSDEADRTAFQGSMSFIDTGTGRIVKKTWTIHPPKQPDDDFAGAAIWSTPAVDTEQKVAYVGTGNPFKAQAEHANANAIVKFDLNRKSKTFGEIVGSYKGTIDEYVPAVSSLPCYDFPNNEPPYYPQGLGACGDIDLDFGAAPNIFRGPGGEKLVGAGQKSGVYHAFEAGSMKPAWTQILGAPGQLGGVVGSTAYDGSGIFGPITQGGYTWAVEPGNGAHRWFAPVADGAHYGPPVSVANGVVYTVDTTGFLNAYDARSGALLAKKHMSSGGTRNPTGSMAWGGVSIARNTVYATTGLSSLSDGYIVAYRPGAPQDTPEDVLDSVGGGGGEDGEDGEGGGDDGGGGGEAAPGGAIVAGPGSTYSTYVTPVMVTQEGGPLNFMNFDLPQHDVIADDKGPDGRPLFQSKLAGIGEIAPIEGLDRVKSGSTYGFYCSLHPGMRGNLIVR